MLAPALASKIPSQPQPPRLPQAYVGWILFLQNQNNNRKSRGGTEKARRGPWVSSDRSVWESRFPIPGQRPRTVRPDLPNPSTPADSLDHPGLPAPSTLPSPTPKLPWKPPWKPSASPDSPAPELPDHPRLA